MRKSSRLFVAIAVAGLVAAGGSAYTAGNTLPDSVAGYGTSTISGATATSLQYTLSGDGAQITGADLEFVGDLTGHTVMAGFGSQPLVTCTVGTVTPALLGVTESSTAVSCTGFTQSTADSATFNVAVSS